MSDFSLPPWKELYVAAILENDQARVLDRIREAKMAICDRVEELGEKGSSAERTALNKANRALTELQDLYLPRAMRNSHTPTQAESVHHKA